MSEAPDLLARGLDLVRAADADGVPVRLLGGAAVRHRCGDAMPDVLQRTFADLDMIASAKAWKAVQRVFEQQGLRPDPHFNALHGSERQIYFLGPGQEPHVDLFLGRFRMCHELDFGDRLEVEPETLAGADLLLTKLQVVQLTRKDVQDAAALLVTHELAEADGPLKLNVKRLTKLTSSDWGLHTTASDNLAGLAGHVERELGDGELAGEVRTRAETLLELLERSPKTLAWKVRAKVGRTVRWYELPEEATAR